MLKNKKKQIVLSLVFWMFFSGMFFSLADFGNRTNVIENNSMSPKSSNGEINLVTPENITYTEGMDGYYPGTYGFENDPDGSLPVEWIDDSTSDCITEVLYESGNHKKVLHLYDPFLSSKQASAYNDWSNWGTQSYGTVEFWFKTSEVNNFNQIVLRYGTTTRLRLIIDNGKWLFHDSKWEVPGLQIEEIDPISNQWYHIRLDFETTTGGYSGLDQYTFRIIVNNEYVSGEMGFDSNGQVNRLLFTTGEDLGYSIDVDAIGYSFDTSYNIGDNLKTGLLVNFESTVDLDSDSMKYSLNGQVNKTILGNTTIQMPVNDLYTIQVFGTYQASIYSSALRYFTVNYTFDIITPVNDTYSAPMAGYYPATYGFEDEKIGTYETNIDFVDYYGNNYLCELYVTGKFKGHRNVLDCYDHSNANGMEIYHFFDSTQENGTVEFWWSVTDVTPGVGFALCHDLTYGPRLDIVNDHIRYFDSSPHEIVEVVDNTWYRITIDFECGNGLYKGLSADTYKISIDGDPKGIFSFDNALSNINRIKIWTGTPATGIHNYIDAIGYNWDPDYEINDNKLTGFLMKYTKNFDTNWVKCSFNGGENKTIDGNYLLPKIEQGSYNVQVFANDSHGITHHTDVRYFSYYKFAKIPASPTNINAMDGINHTYITWDAPTESNAPILKYNVYRGDQMSKSLLNSTTDTFFNDTDSKNYIGQRFYYYITTVNIVGESDPSEEDYATARNLPTVEWKSPCEWEQVIFAPGNLDTFDIEYNSVSLDDVRLFLNNKDYGSVYNSSSVQFIYGEEQLEGIVNGTLIGYQYGIPITSHSRNFTFGKLEIEVIEILDSGTEFIGDVLYLILHDPVGDNSFSGFEKSTSLCTKVSSKFTAGEGIGIKIGAEKGLFHAYAATNLEWKQSDEDSATFRVTDTSGFTSNLEANDKNFIGPGFGDIYWGEAQVLNYEFKGYYREYYNGTKRYEDPMLNWGILRNSEVYLSDKNAPEEWRMQNPVHNGWQNVDWDWVDSGYKTYVGGTEKKFIHENVSTIVRSHTVSFTLDTDVSFGYNDFDLDLSLDLEWENFEENEVETKYQVSYTVYDDEPTDFLCQRVGLDKRFGTIVFKPHPGISKTSNPLEYNSSDYIAPLIDFPSIEFDTNNDGLGPCSDDSPEINVGISDEGGVQLAASTYSTDDGVSWHSIILDEQLGNPGTWGGFLPTQDHGTNVKWYLRVWDFEGYLATRYDEYNNTYSYTVLNRNPEVQVTSPIGGEIFKNSVLISWSGTDPENDDLNYTLAYNNGGIGWHLIARNIIDTSYIWDIRNLPYSKSILIKVIANDGYGGTNEDISEFLFTIGEPSIPSIFDNNLTAMFIGTGLNAGLIAIAVVLLKKFRSN